MATTRKRKNQTAKAKDTENLDFSGKSYLVLKNVPLPKSAKSRESKYPLDKLNEGMCLIYRDANRAALNSAVQVYKRKPENEGKKFTIRTREDGTIGVWRIK